MPNSKAPARASKPSAHPVRDAADALYRAAKESVDTALKYAYVGRRRKKRDFRRLWVMRINAAAREHGLTYGQLIAGLKAAGNPIDRKSLADLAVTSPAAFARIARVAADAKPAARA